jgi:hypothetical protein
LKSELWRQLEADYTRFPNLRAEVLPSREAIQDVESQLGIPLPADYVEFLLRFGSGIVGSLPVLGMSQAPAMGKSTWSVLDVTSKFRREGWPNVEQWAVFSVDLSGNPIGFDRLGVVWTYDHDAVELFRLYENFEDFVDANLASTDHPN